MVWSGLEWFGGGPSGRKASLQAVVEWFGVVFPSGRSMSIRISEAFGVVWSRLECFGVILE